MIKDTLTALVILLLTASGCSWPIAPDKMPDVIKELAKDSASGCIWVGIRGGAGGGSVIPPSPMTGGYGSGEILLGRVNAENTKVTINNGACSIERGAAPAK